MRGFGSMVRSSRRVCMLLRRFERNGTQMEFILIIALFIDSLESYRPCTLCISLNCETRDTLFNNTSWRVSYRFVSSVSSSMRSKATIERWKDQASFVRRIIRPQKSSILETNFTLPRSELEDSHVKEKSSEDRLDLCGDLRCIIGGSIRSSIVR